MSEEYKSTSTSVKAEATVKPSGKRAAKESELRAALEKAKAEK